MPTISISKKWGVLLLGVFLILFGTAQFNWVAVHPYLLGGLAIAAGVFIIIDY